MTHYDSERGLVRKTGESLSTIRRRGFSLVKPPELVPLIIDWDQLKSDRPRVLPARQGGSMAASQRPSGHSTFTASRHGGLV